MTDVVEKKEPWIDLTPRAPDTKKIEMYLLSILVFVGFLGIMIMWNNIEISNLSVKVNHLNVSSETCNIKPFVNDTQVIYSNSSLIEFYGEECPHCIKMKPIVSQVEVDLNVSFSKLEVWHNTTNQKVMEGYSSIISVACGGGLGVPAFYNQNTGKALCGEVTKEVLSSFILEKR